MKLSQYLLIGDQNSSRLIGRRIVHFADFGIKIHNTLFPQDGENLCFRFIKKNFFEGHAAESLSNNLMIIN